MESEAEAYRRCLDNLPSVEEGVDHVAQYLREHPVALPLPVRRGRPSLLAALFDGVAKWEGEEELRRRNAIHQAFSGVDPIYAWGMSLAISDGYAGKPLPSFRKFCTPPFDPKGYHATTIAPLTYELYKWGRNVGVALREGGVI